MKVKARCKFGNAKWFFISLSLLFFSGCSTISEYAGKAKNVTIDTAENLGLVSEQKLQVPDYYSTEYLSTSYKPGQQIKLESLQCPKYKGCNE